MRKVQTNAQAKREKTNYTIFSAKFSRARERMKEAGPKVSNTLSPIFYLFLAPSGKLYLKVQHLLAEDKLVQSSNPPLLKRRRPGPKHPSSGIPADLWPTVLQRVVERKEPLRTVAAAYGVSHETIRRIVLHVQKQHRQERT
jgi:hypothetical protein